eukprot:TRINITY_DN68557_c0_g1_i1.p1 TRINITY_DN68557_c0_g1~~TRINITY_DN68557_c0_g1_i1.p1  ORF type:complete len:184 (-),score=37.51 TRINITY_DN68557_c0_g1_i1:107-658(-)
MSLGSDETGLSAEACFLCQQDATKALVCPWCHPRSRCMICLDCDQRSADKLLCPGCGQQLQGSLQTVSDLNSSVHGNGSGEFGADVQTGSSHTTSSTTTLAAAAAKTSAPSVAGSSTAAPGSEAAPSAAPSVAGGFEAAPAEEQNFVEEDEEDLDGSLNSTSTMVQETRGVPYMRHAASDPPP